MSILFTLNHTYPNKSRKMLFFTLISLSFLIINSFIILSDVKEKKIPNRYLLCLLCLLWVYYIYLYTHWFHFSWYFLLQILVSLFISFTLYYFWVWSAGDAKYLLILALFIPQIWVIPFIWNIWLITFSYMILYSIYFYLKLFFDKFYRKSLIKNIIVDYGDILINFIKNPQTWEINKNDAFTKILKQGVYFLLFFVSIRLIRWDLFEYIKSLWYIKNNLGDFWSYIFLFMWLLSILLVFIYNYVTGKIIKFFIGIKNLFNIDMSERTTKIIKIYILFLVLLCIIVFDYLRTWNELFHKLYTILTLYLLLYLLIKILFYWYKLTFRVAEQNYIDIKHLKEWDIIDKEHLIKIFWKQEALWYGENKEWMLYPDPWIYFHNIDNPVDTETVDTLNKIYDRVYAYHKEHNNKFEKNNEIRILKTFAFWGYIFTWFLITYLWGDGISKFIVQTGIELFKRFMWH